MKARSKLLAITIALLTAANVYAECATRNFSKMEQEVIHAYIAYYGRVPDAAGLYYWAGEIGSRGGSLSAIIDAFGNSDEFTKTFGELSNRDLIDNLYVQAFGRAADHAGLNYYLAEIEAGNLSLQQIALSIVDGALGDDSRVLENRTQVAQHYVTGVEATGHEIDIEDMRAVMTEVKSTNRSSATACADYDALIAEAAQDITGLSCDNGSNNNQPVKKAGQLVGVYGLSYFSEAQGALNGIKKTIRGETSATGKFEYYETCDEPATVSFCIGIKKNCGGIEQATGIMPLLAIDRRIISQFSSYSFSSYTNGITLKEGIANAFSISDRKDKKAILTNIYQLLIGLDIDADIKNGIQLDQETRSRVDTVADDIDFTFAEFDRDPNVVNLVTATGRPFPSKERVAAFQNIVEFQSTETGFFDASDFDDYLVLAADATSDMGNLFVGVHHGTFSDTQQVFFDKPVNDSQFGFRRLLSNHFDKSGNVSSVTIDMTLVNFDRHTGSNPGTPDTPSSITDRHHSPDTLCNPDCRHTSWKFAQYSKDSQAIDLYVFDDTDTKPIAPAHEYDQSDATHWRFNYIPQPPSAFPDANAQITIYDKSGVLLAKHLVALATY